MQNCLVVSLSRLLLGMLSNLTDDTCLLLRLLSAAVPNAKKQTGPHVTTMNAFLRRQVKVVLLAAVVGTGDRPALGPIRPRSSLIVSAYEIQYHRWRWRQEYITLSDDLSRRLR